MNDIFFLGVIQIFAFNFAPLGWEKCAGQTLQISKYQGLFSLIGNKFGGDGITTFMLPDLHGAIPLQAPSFMNYYICTDGGTYPSHTI